MNPDSPDIKFWIPDDGDSEEDATVFKINIERYPNRNDIETAASEFVKSRCGENVATHMQEFIVHFRLGDGPSKRVRVTVRRTVHYAGYIVGLL